MAFRGECSRVSTLIRCALSRFEERIDPPFSPVLNVKSSPGETAGSAGRGSWRCTAGVSWFCTGGISCFCLVGASWFAGGFAGGSVCAARGYAIKVKRRIIAAILLVTYCCILPLLLIMYPV